MSFKQWFSSQIVYTGLWFYAERSYTKREHLSEGCRAISQNLMTMRYERSRASGLHKRGSKYCWRHRNRLLLLLLCTSFSVVFLSTDWLLPHIILSDTQCLFKAPEIIKNAVTHRGWFFIYLSTCMCVCVWVCIHPHYNYNYNIIINLNNSKFIIKIQ